VASARTINSCSQDVSLADKLPCLPLQRAYPHSIACSLAPTIIMKGCKSGRWIALLAHAASVPSHHHPRLSASTTCSVGKSIRSIALVPPTTSISSLHGPCPSTPTIMFLEGKFLGWIALLVLQRTLPQTIVPVRRHQSILGCKSCHWLVLPAPSERALILSSPSAGADHVVRP